MTPTTFVQSKKDIKEDGKREEERGNEDEKREEVEERKEEGITPVADANGDVEGETPQYERPMKKERERHLFPFTPEVPRKKRRLSLTVHHCFKGHKAIATHHYKGKYKESGLFFCDLCGQVNYSRMPRWRCRETCSKFDVCFECWPQSKILWIDADSQYSDGDKEY